jgi:hypothetical protein
MYNTPQLALGFIPVIPVSKADLSQIKENLSIANYG